MTISNEELSALLGAPETPDTIRSILTELIAAREALTWQDISAAPAGESVLIAVLHNNGKWGVGEARLRVEGDDDDGWWWAGEGPGDYYASVIFPEPSAWLPLPPPPALSQPKEG